MSLEAQLDVEQRSDFQPDLQICLKELLKT
jgi:hypothetical protein